MITTTYNILPATSRVWTYQSDRLFTAEELPKIETQIQQFARSWVSHSNQLQAFAEIRYDRFVVLMVDESRAGASGCSIDSSVRFMQQLGQEYGVDFFNRMLFAYQKGGEVFSVPRMEFVALYKAGKINDDTLVFDTLVKTKGDLDTKWLKPLGESWHKRMV